MTLRTFRNALIVMGAFLALIWILQVANWADGYRLDGDYGIYPDNVGRLPDIFAAPFLHVSWQHIEGNSVPLFVLGVLAAYRSIRRFLLVSLIVAVSPDEPQDREAAAPGCGDPRLPCPPSDHQARQDPQRDRGRGAGRGRDAAAEG